MSKDDPNMNPLTELQALLASGKITAKDLQRLLDQQHSSTESTVDHGVLADEADSVVLTDDTADDAADIIEISGDDLTSEYDEYFQQDISDEELRQLIYKLETGLTLSQDEDDDSKPAHVIDSLKQLMSRSITPEEIAYLLSRWPFLQLVGDSSAKSYPDVQLLAAPSGWTVHHYGNALSSSPGLFLFGGGDFKIRLSGDEDDGGDGGDGIINPGKGTIWAQAFVTAQHMVALALEAGWLGIKMVDGHRLMQWAAWVACEDAGFTLQGFEPTQQDYRKRQRLKRSHIEEQKMRLRAQMG